MQRAKVLEMLARITPMLVARYGIVSLALFGSTVRDTAQAGSDIDILVSFDGRATSERYFGIQFVLERVHDLSNVVTAPNLRATNAL